MKNKFVIVLICIIIIGSSWRYFLSDNNEDIKPIILTSPSNMIHYVEWDIDGNKLGSISQHRNEINCEIEIWDYSQMQLERIIESNNFTWNSQIVWSPNRSIVAVNGFNRSTNLGVVHLYNTSTWEPFSYLVGDFSSIQSIDWSWNGQYLAAVSETGNHQFSKIIIWNSATWNEIIIIQDCPISNIEWHPHDDTLATAQADNTVRIYNTTGHQIRLLRDHTDSVNRVRWSPQANLLASTSTDGIFVYDTSTWTITGKIENYNHSHFRDDIAWNHDGSKIASTSDHYRLAITIFSIESYDWVIELFGHKEKTKLSWDTNNDLLASSATDGTIEIWDI